jgi:hypothetical protein
VPPLRCRVTAVWPRHRCGAVLGPISHL